MASPQKQVMVVCFTFFIPRIIPLSSPQKLGAAGLAAPGIVDG
jgi:hypothetical protein